MAQAAGRFENLQVLRFAAAMLVVAFHAGQAYAAEGGMLPIDYVNAIGFSGVDLFFVISGFIIYRTTIGAGGTRPAAIFLVRRYGRIFLPYWPIVLPLGAAVTLVSPVAVDWIKSVTLWPYTSGDYLIPAAWTLAFELAYYTVFAVAILVSARVLIFVLSAAFVVTIVGLSFAHVAMPDWLAYAANPLDLEFLLGVTVGWLTLKFTSRHTAGPGCWRPELPVSWRWAASLWSRNCRPAVHLVTWYARPVSGRCRRYWLSPLSGWSRRSDHQDGSCCSATRPTRSISSMEWC